MSDIDWAGTTDEALHTIATATFGPTRRAAKLELTRRQEADPENARRRRMEQRLEVAKSALLEAQAALTQATLMAGEDTKADVQAQLDSVSSVLEQLAPTTAPTVTDVAVSEVTTTSTETQPEPVAPEQDQPEPRRATDRTVPDGSHRPS